MSDAASLPELQPGAAQQPVSPSRPFLPRLSTSDHEALEANQHGITLTMRQIDSDLTGQQLKDHLAELLLPELLFRDDVRTFKATYPKLRDLLNQNKDTIPTHSAHPIMCQIASRLYEEPYEGEIAD